MQVSDLFHGIGRFFFVSGRMTPICPFNKAFRIADEANHMILRARKPSISIQFVTLGPKRPLKRSEVKE